jgi:hypothetical protein
MSRRSCVHTAFLIGMTFLILTLLPTESVAQNDGYLTNSNTRGLEATNPFQIGDIDSINLANGALSLRIPVFQRKGRGGRLDRQYFFPYTSKIWTLVPVWDNVSPTVLDGLYWAVSPQTSYYPLVPLANAPNLVLWGGARG